MVEQVWLHIGTPKSGTSSLQKYLVAHCDALTGQGLAYLTPPGKTSSNDLAIAINRARPELVDLARGMDREIAQRPEKIALISSEMFYGIDPDTVLKLMPALADRPLKVLVYLRRQDRYIESMFLQKSKNGRFKGSVSDYIAKFDGSGSDFHAMLAPWHDRGVLVPRVLERDKLIRGDVIADAFAQMGLPEPSPETPEDVNISPGFARLQLLQAAASVDIANPRRLQRLLAARYPQDSDERTPILRRTERREFLARFTAGNEALRKSYFPELGSLFDDSGLQGADSPRAVEAFSDRQLQEIARLLDVVKSLK